MTSKASYQPESYQSVIPYIHANNARTLISFLKEVFDAQEIAVYTRLMELSVMRRSGLATRSWS